MASRFLRLNAVTSQDRQAAILSARETMSRSGRAILDFQMFSNTSICFRIEIAAEDVGQFHANLMTTHLRLSHQSVEALSSFTGRSGDRNDIMGTFEITFIHSDPDLRHEVPAIG